jgi:predicted peroxiredoxin
MTRGLIIIDRAYRGSVETQFADVLYFIRELSRQLGGLDLVLRGLAVTYAVKGICPTIRLAGRHVHTLPDPRRSIQTLLDEGVTVFVEEPDLAALGLFNGDHLLSGVCLVSVGELALRWSDYLGVWFL